MPATEIAYDHADWADAKFEDHRRKPVTVASRAAAGLRRTLHSHAARARDAAHQWRERLWRAARFAVFVHDPGDGRPADEIFRRQSAARFEAGCQDRPHHRHIEKEGRIHRHVAREKFPRHGGKKIPHRLRRPDCAHAADGLEQLELFCRRGFGGKSQRRGGCDGQERPHQSRLDLHQRGRLLAEPSRLERPDVARTIPRRGRATSCRTRVFPT